MRIVKLEKKSKLAIAISTILALVIVVACFTTACQPTPENEVVVGKGKQQVEKMIEKAMDNDNTSQNNTARLDYETPEALNYVLESELVGAKIKVDVDAGVIIPENTLPISTAELKNITYTQVDNLLKLLVGDEKLYERMSAENLETKETMQQAIDFYNILINDLVNNPESKEYVEEIKASMKRLYQEIQTAPDTFSEAKDINGDSPEEVIITENNYDMQNYDLAVGTSYIHANLSIQAQKSYKMRKISYAVIGPFLPESLYYPELMANFEMSIDEAIERAKPIVDCLDPGLVLTDVSPSLQRDFEGELTAFGYTLIYTRQYSGVNTNYAVENNEWKYKKDATESSSGVVTYGTSGVMVEEIPNTQIYKEPYPQETLVITVGLEGVQAVSYTSPMQVSEVLAGNSALMPFNDVQDIFDQHIVLNGFDPSKEVYLNIDRVQLGMMRIDQQNSDEYLIVPVWDFYGNYVASRNNEHLEDNPKPRKHYGRSFLTINAVDGSIIDRELGY